MLFVPNLLKGRVSVSLRIALYISIAFSFILLLISFLIVSSVHIFLLKESEQFLMYNKNIIINELSNSPGNEVEALTELSVSRNVQTSLYTAEGFLLFVKNEMFPETLISADGIEEIRLPDNHDIPENDHYTQEGDFNGLHYMVLRYTVHNLSIGNNYIIQIAKDLSEVDYFIAILYKFLILTNIAGLIIAVAAGFLISRRVLHPITQVTDTALRISEKELTMRIPVTGPEDELNKLAKAFNGMLNRLDDSFKRQNRFVSNASHELRTPLSIINGYIGILSRWGIEDPHVLAESLDAIRAETKRMASLIEKLLFLAKNADGGMQLRKEPVDMGILFQEIKKDSELLFPEKKFNFNIEQGCIVLGSKDMLRQMLLVFLDNEGKYCSKEGTVIFSLHRGKESIAVIIQDDGPGMEQTKIKYIFDRFYRLDDARDKASGGSGLGLSIAKEIIELHGGSVNVKSSIGQGTVFTLNFPL